MRKYIKIDRYLVDLNRQLGEGSAGRVYVGYPSQEQADRTPAYAVKTIPVGSTYSITESILQEINLLRTLQHPNVVLFVDAKKTSDHIYLILEYCCQGSLHARIEAGKIPEPQSLLYLRQIVSAFLYIDSRGIIHRDIKPRNLLLSGPLLKVADFGLAKILVSDEVEFSGTLDYMAPQILSGDKYSGLCDVWSTGVTLYEMIFGAKPWTGDTPEALLGAIEARLPTLLADCEDVSAPTQDLLLRMLRLRESDRITWREIARHPALGEPIDFAEESGLPGRKVTLLAKDTINLRKLSSSSDDPLN
jgi:serine/threonine-protein kinase ULK/ATG1